MYWFFVVAVAAVGFVWVKVRRQRKAAASPATPS
jgi:hypothetical protein